MSHFYAIYHYLNIKHVKVKDDRAPEVTSKGFIFRNNWIHTIDSLHLHNSKGCGNRVLQKTQILLLVTTQRIDWIQELFVDEIARL